MTQELRKGFATYLIAKDKGVMYNPEEDRMIMTTFPLSKNRRQKPYTGRGLRLDIYLQPESCVVYPLIETGAGHKSLDIEEKEFYFDKDITLSEFINLFSSHVMEQTEKALRLLDLEGLYKDINISFLKAFITNFNNWSEVLEQDGNTFKQLNHLGILDTIFAYVKEKDYPYYIEEDEELQVFKVYTLPPSKDIKLFHFDGRVTEPPRRKA